MATVAVSACGSSSGSPKLSVEERAKVADAEAALNGVVLDGREPEHARETLQFMLRLCASKGSAVYDPGQDEREVREVAADEAETLDGWRDSWAHQLRNHCKVK